jgi:hypothetical protein
MVGERHGMCESALMTPFLHYGYNDVPHLRGLGSSVSLYRILCNCLVLHNPAALVVIASAQ